jgi:uncharacterized membrane protein (DUF373 family)
VADAPDAGDDRDGSKDGVGAGEFHVDTHPPPPIINRALELAENVVYCLVSLVLIGASVLLLGQGAYDLVTSADDGVATAIRDVLDTLLLVFILVELLAATRETMNQRKIVAEPFLLVGIIASIKEVVVLGIGAKEDLGKNKERFESAMLGIGTISGLLLVLSIAILLNRRREREPEED